MKKESSFSIALLKKGTEDSQEPWIEMRTVSDIFKHCCTLSKKGRKKMFKEFADMMEISVALKELADSTTESGKSDLDMPVFKWRND